MFTSSKVQVISTHDFTDCSVHKLLKYVTTEVVFLENHIRNEVAKQNNPQEHANDEYSSETMGTVALENMLWDSLFSILFDTETLGMLGGILTADTFATFMHGMTMALDQQFNTDLRTPFVLSLYPKGRKNVQIIMDNMQASPMRRAAQQQFMTVGEANSQVKILREAQKKLEKLYKSQVNELRLGAEETVHQSISRAYKNVSYGM